MPKDIRHSGTNCVVAFPIPLVAPGVGQQACAPPRLRSGSMTRHVTGATGAHRLRPAGTNVHRPANGWKKRSSPSVYRMAQAQCCCQRAQSLRRSIALGWFAHHARTRRQLRQDPHQELLTYHEDIHMRSKSRGTQRRPTSTTWAEQQSGGCSESMACQAARWVAEPHIILR